MTTQIFINDNTPIAIELHPARGVQDVAITPEALITKSNEALNNAMVSIYGMSQRIVSTMKSIDWADRPDVVKVNFGLKLSTDANAIIVNAGIEAQIEVMLKWEKKLEEKESV